MVGDRKHCTQFSIAVIDLSADLRHKTLKYVLIVCVLHMPYSRSLEISNLFDYEYPFFFFFLVLPIYIHFVCFKGSILGKGRSSVHCPLAFFFLTGV